MRLLKFLLLVALSFVPSFMMAQNEALTGDSIVSVGELWKIHRMEAKQRGPRPRRDTENGRIPVLSLRANLLRWVTFTPEAGLIWHCARRWDIQLNGAWTSIALSANKKRRRYALWTLSPEVRYYLGSNERYYVGAQLELGQRNYKLKTEGRQGKVYGGGLVGGYQWRVSPHVSVDLHIGVGYNWGTMQHYNEEVYYKAQQPSFTLNYTEDERRFGINHLGLSLVWDLYGRKGGRQ